MATAAGSKRVVPAVSSRQAGRRESTCPVDANGDVVIDYGNGYRHAGMDAVGAGRVLFSQEQRHDDLIGFATIQKGKSIGIFDDTVQLPTGLKAGSAFCQDSTEAWR